MSQYMDMVRRRWPYVVTIIPAVLLVAVFFAFYLTPMYQSSAAIMLEESSIDPALIKTTVRSYADQQIELVERVVMTTDRLQPVVEELDPYPDMPDLSVRDKARLIIDNTTLEKVDPVTMEPLPTSNAFSIKYRNPSPELAQAVTEKISELFLTHNREVRTEQARGAYDFLLVNSEALEEQMLDIERRISAFKEKYGEALPEAQARNENAVDRLQRDYDGLMAQVRLIEQQESMFKLQLSQISPMLVAEEGGDVYTQLGKLRAELADAQQKYTPEHPDVKRLRRAIQTLAEQAKLGNPQNVRPDNPEYLRVAAELQAVQTNLAALRSNAARAQNQIAQYQSFLTQTPGVEREYTQLMRESEIARQQYADIQAKLRDAALSQRLESQAKGDRYTLISDAYYPSKPASPNRLGIIMLGIVLGGGLAFGIAAFRESTDPTVRSSADVADIGDLPVIGAVPSLLNDAERRRRRVVWGGVAGAYAVATLVVAITVLQAS